MNEDILIKVIDWLVNEETGLSSKSFAAGCLGIPVKDFCFPYDPDDFRRIMGLLIFVPELRVNLKPMLFKQGEVGKKFSREWDNLEKLYFRDVHKVKSEELYEAIKNCRH